MSVSRPLVLGIETSCDDTACALLDGEGRVLSSVVSSQLEAHGPYGGVVPEIASREHLRHWPRVSRAALERANATLSEVDAVAATRGPGLIGCLLVGLSLGRAMAFALRTGLIPVTVPKTVRVMVEGEDPKEVQKVAEELAALAQKQG